MSNELLTIDPVDLQFPFELKKQISCSLYLGNKTDNYVAFKVKTTNPKKYCVRPNTGVVHPRSSSEFSKEAGHRVEETKLKVVYVAPPRPPSPVREGSEEGSSPRASVSDNGNASDFTAAPRFSADRLDAQDNSSEDQLQRESKRSQSGGIPLMYVLLVGLIGLILGYIMKRT
ncbi:hypothetical protein CARUB_v10024627mg [Capsella rubella]|uniref:MSP domain-containing protein n=1 Tax=Capsella rubella TaxID=81985 RepID=R0HSS6_9BRAS|nr:hypothetical protein CARUB_v10024627mg [Capsella rubella]